MSPLFLGLLSGFSAYFIFAGMNRRAQLRAQRSMVQETLQEFAAHSQEELAEIQRLQYQQQGTPLTRRIGRSLDAIALQNHYGVSLSAWLNQTLDRAGRPSGWGSSPHDFIGFTAMLVGGSVVGGGLLINATGSPKILYLMLVALAVAYPLNSVRSAIRKRQEQAFAELPNFLDQIVLNLSSGTRTLDGALRHVLLGDDRTLEGERDRILVQEFRRAYLENANQQRPFSEAYRAVYNRLPVPDVGNLVEIFVESQQGGGGAHVTQQLRNMSTHVYANYEHDMTTLIKKKDTTFTVATVLIMFGSAVVIATPIFVTVLEALSGAWR